MSDWWQSTAFVVTPWTLAASAAAVALVFALLAALEIATRAPFPVKGSLLVITGAAGDIGRQFACQAAAAGAKLALWDVDGDRLAQLRRENPKVVRSTVHWASFDVTDAGEGERALRAAVSAAGGLRRLVLVNNAGVVDGQRATEADEARAEVVLRVNLEAPARLARAALRLAAGPDPWRVKVVNMCSVMGLLGGGALASYCASKAGLLRATEAMALDVESAGLWPRASLLAVCPFAVEGSLFGGIFGSPVPPGGGTPPPRAGRAAPGERPAPTPAGARCAERPGWMSSLAAVTPRDNVLRSALYPFLRPDGVAAASLAAVESGARLAVLPASLGVLITVARILPSGFMAVLAGFMGGWQGMSTWGGGRAMAGPAEDTAPQGGDVVPADGSAGARRRKRGVVAE